MENEKIYTTESIGIEVDKISSKLDAMQKAMERGKRATTARAITGFGGGATIALMIAGGTTHNTEFTWGAMFLLVLIMAVTVLPEWLTRRQEAKSLKINEKK